MNVASGKHEIQHCICDCDSESTGSIESALKSLPIKSIIGL